MINVFLVDSDIGEPLELRHARKMRLKEVK